MKIPFSVVFLFICLVCISQTNPPLDLIVSYTADPVTQNIEFFWKNDNGELFRSIGNLKEWVEKNGHKLIFAMNGGIYTESRNPLGLFVQNGKTIKGLNTTTGYGNFYMQPNGVFYLTNDNVAEIKSTSGFKNGGQVKYATQSGPMLVINGKVNPIFVKNSQSRYIRNGVGILPGNKIMFAISTDPVNFYELADFFQKAGCIDALYLDGFVSRMYLPEKNRKMTDGNFAVIMAITN
jgi:uncharacterized protein YigE (DUF2233 family)